MSKYLFQKRGFTLTEVLLVVGIISILAAIAIPTYFDYIVSSRVSEGMTLVELPKLSVTEFYNVEAKLPTTAEGTSLKGTGSVAATSDFVSTINWTRTDDNNGYLEITFQDIASLGSARNTSIRMNATFSGTGPLSWSCSIPVTGGTPRSVAPATCS